MLATNDLEIQVKTLQAQLYEKRQKDKASWAMHLAIVKTSIKQPKRTHKVEVRGTTDRGKPYSYTYKYADLSDVDKSVMDAIIETKQNGKPLLTYYFDVDNQQDGVQVETIIVDATTGYSVRTNKIWFKNLKTSDAQATASLISYAKRYSLSAAFGIASEDDDDAQAGTRKPAKTYNDEELNVIWDAYVNDQSETAKKWIKSHHDAQTTAAIKKKIDAYNFTKRLDKVKEQSKKKRQQNPKKSKEKEDEVIKKIVDGGADPYEDKKEDKPMTDEQQSLFNDILG
ncbi:ERF family protein [Lactobacillus gallinarum]|uniref:ERF family protein n=1 Tax=Lactobacillus gallinarum TaxID=52242 RepID=UPI0024B27986|nr:ERF family protein [Lactobacillus gallinarum]